MVQAMAKRHEEWEQKKRDFANAQMEALKEKILTHAKEELRKVVNREKVKKQATERAARDAEIARKRRAEGADDEPAFDFSTTTAGAGASAGGPPAAGWGRSQKPAAAAVPDAATRPSRPPREGAEDNAFKRSDKPRASAEEAKKPEGLARAPRREPPADTGFSRGNFTKKEEGEKGEEKKGEERERKPRAAGPRDAEPKKEGGDSGFGFRSTNAGASRGAARGAGSGARGGARKIV